MKQVLKHLKTNPKQLFLIDGIGAIISVFLLSVVLVQFESFFGIPKQTLYLLATLPCFFAMYDFYCYFNTNKNIAFFIKVIAFVNICYCCTSIGFVLYHKETITTLGCSYIFAEIVIVLLLALLELKVANYKIN